MEDFGKSCLTVAIENVEKDEIENLLVCLLENGANPNMPDHNGHTPLLHAVIKYSGDDIFPRWFFYLFGKEVFYHRTKAEIGITLIHTLQSHGNGFSTELNLT